MQFVASPDEAWVLPPEVQVPAADKRVYDRYLALRRYRALQGSLDPAETQTRSQLCTKYQFDKHDVPERTIERYWEVLDRSLANTQGDLVWAPALMEALNEIYRSHFGQKGWTEEVPFQERDGRSDNPFALRDLAWQGLLKAYYEEIDKTVIKFWEAAMKRLDPESDADKILALKCAPAKWKFIRRLRSYSSYYDYPLPSADCVHDAFKNLKNVNQAICFVSHLIPLQAHICQRFGHVALHTSNTCTHVGIVQRARCPDVQTTDGRERCCAAIAPMNSRRVSACASMLDPPLTIGNSGARAVGAARTAMCCQRITTLMGLFVRSHGHWTRLRTTAAERTTTPRVYSISLLATT